MQPQDDALTAAILANPKYQLLHARRTRLGWTLTTVVLIAYFGFIGLIAFDKPFLAQRLGPGVTTLGVPVAIGLIVLTILLTAFYVWRANRDFDRLTAELRQEVGA